MRRRVITTHVDGWVDPAECFETFCGGSEPAYWLDSGVNAATGMSCMGIGSRAVTARAGKLHEWPSGLSRSESIFAFLRRELTSRTMPGDERSGFPLGWVGWLGYELHEETLLTGAHRNSRYPDAAFTFADRSIVFDHSKRRISLAALGDAWSGELARWRDEVTQKLAVIANANGSAQRGESAIRTRGSGENAGGATSTTHSAWAYSDARYREMITKCQASIRAGDAYQLCLTTQITLPLRPNPMTTYLRLREVSPSHHGGFVRIGEVNLLSSSPEKFLSVSEDGAVETQPIKGTRRRGGTPEEDAALRGELEANVKERAENLMIVDLVRNDLARVCAVGSVSVPKLFDVETYAQVHQLVSTVRGVLAPGKTAVDAVISCFPAGSMTGAPKLSAVRLVDALEERARGIYSGAWGYFGLDGSANLAMTIRSMVIDAEGTTIGTGGGITALSIPEEELEETRIKAAALLRTLGLVTL